METIVLLYREEALRAFELGAQPLEVGSGAGCDVVVHDTDVAERHLVIGREDADVVAFELGERGRGRKIVLRPGEVLALSRLHGIMRVPDAPTKPHVISLRTEPIAIRSEERSTLSILIGRGPEARRILVAGRPISIGASTDCDVVVHDRAVSARHCRIDPSEDGPVVRDLQSRNGTFVDGVRTFVARIGPGTRLRIGRTELLAVARGASGDARSDGLVAASAAMLDILGLVERYARLPYPVVIIGESGTGKEGIARALHMRGPRRERSFVAVNAGGLAPDLVESELFGHEKGAFTGAVGARRGVFEQADGGTLFLDEIGELPLALQARLLRVLETKEVRRVGGEHDVRVDVRVVCATHRDLHAMVEGGTFREDLFYRLGQLFVDVPPLSERPEDVRALASHFLAAVSRELGPREISQAALERLLAHDWPGNARELRNVIQNAAATSPGIVDEMDVENALRQMTGGRARTKSGRITIAEQLAQYEGNLSAASRALGIPRTTLRDRLRSTK